MKYWGHTHYIGIICLIIRSGEIVADQIQLENTTDNDMYGAIYYYKNDAVLATGPTKIPAHAQVRIERPERKSYSTFPPLFFDRELLVAAQPNVFKKNLRVDEFKQFASTNVGDKWSVLGSFYIGMSQGTIKVFNSAEWKALEPLKKVAQEVGKAAKIYVKENSIAVKQDPYKTMQAQVRIDNSLCDQERMYLAHRLPRVKAALAPMLGVPARTLEGAYIPRVAFVCSGGGYRAMLCTTGSLVGAQTIGLLDATTWVVGLSGSTWALGAWTAGGLSIEEFKQKLLIKVTKNIYDLTPDESQLLINALLVKYAFDEPLTLVDVYGTLLANRLLSDFGDARHRVYLSEQKARINDGGWVFPIYTAVRGDVGGNHEWYEYTPYEIGSAWLRAYVPTWGFGREFAQGKSINNPPEQSLGFHFGTYGSAFAANVDTIYQTLIKSLEKSHASHAASVSLTVRSITDQLGVQLIKQIGDTRFTWAEVPNFTRGMQQSSIQNQVDMRLVDAGLDFNLPYPPISGERPERTADIIIFLDASESLQNGSALRKAQEYAQKRGLKFPSIDYTNVGKEAVSIFKDEKEAGVPVVIYMPRIKEGQLVSTYKNVPEFVQLSKIIESFDPEKCVKESGCKTFNFMYAPEEAAGLVALAEFNMRAAKQRIVNEIRWVMEKNSKVSASH